MAPNVGRALEEFLALNQRLLAERLEDDDYERWDVLAATLDGTAVQLEARPRGGYTRRRHARVPLRCAVELMRPSAGRCAETLDLSCGGFSLTAPCQLTPGDSIEFSIGLPARGGGMRARGLVCWATPARTPGQWRAGVAFLGLSPEQRDLVTACVLEKVGPALFGA